MSEKTGGPAFPATTINDTEGDLIDPFGTLLPPGTQCAYPGMMLRDYFAAKALPVAWKAFDDGYFDAGSHDSSNDAVAVCAYQIADAMLKARSA